MEKEIPQLSQGVRAKSPDSTSKEQTVPSAKSNFVLENSAKQIHNQNYGSSNGNRPVAMVEPLQQQKFQEDGAGDNSPDDQMDNAAEVASKPKAKFDLVTQLKKGCILTLVSTRLNFGVVHCLYISMIMLSLR